MHLRNNLSMKLIFLACALMAFSLSSISCKDDSAQVPPAAPVPPKKAAPKAVQKGSEKNDEGVTKNDVYYYNPNGKVDPFVPLITSTPLSETPESSKKEKKDIPLSPLQKLDIDDFSLSAVILSDKGLRALLEDPAMNGFIVKEGMLIGKNEGVIKRILPNSLIIEEQETDSQGNLEKKIKTITLKKQ